MSAIAEIIYREAQRLPENLARQVYDYICFIEKQHGVKAKQESIPSADWQTFFDQFTRTMTDAQPLTRDEIYADRLR
ncbi:MAG: hypothetical protein IPL59_10750 [Candidatus Competibacteraceae bacterium]|nr:hypothetical protein [Candidatus Competibacteraceae bacterium]